MDNRLTRRGRRLLAAAGVIALIGSGTNAQQQRFFRPQQGGTTSGRSRTSSSASGDSTALGEAHFEVDAESRTIIVTTDEETNAHIKEIVNNLDRPIPQALIKVLFLEVTHGDDLDLGAEFSYDNDKGDGDRTGVESLFGVQAATEGAIVNILDGDLRVTLAALSEVAKLEVLSRPSVMARNNQEATITIGQEVPFIRNTRITSDGQQINTVEYEDIGIILRVRPIIGSNGMVELDVAPEISTLTGDLVLIQGGTEGAGQVYAPVYAKRSAETRVVVPSGKTVVIGGLMEDQETENVKKVPILGDIWGIGSLFRRTVREKNKTELLIFLTPTVVMTPEQLAEVRAEEEGHFKMVPDAFGEKLLKEYLQPSED